MGDVTVRAIEPLALFAHRLDEQHASVLPPAELPGSLYTNSESWELLREAQRAQRAYHVGWNYNSRANFAQFWRVLVNRHVESYLPEEQCGCQTAEAAANNCDSQRH